MAFVRREKETKKPKPRPGFEGVVISSVPVWLNKNNEKPTKYFDTRIEYDDGGGIKRAQCFVRAFEYLPPDALVRVQVSRSGRLRIAPDIDDTPQPGATWRNPDIKTGVIALIIGAFIVAAIVGGVFLYLKVSQGQLTKISEQNPGKDMPITPTIPFTPPPASQEPPATGIPA